MMPGRSLILVWVISVFLITAEVFSDAFNILIKPSELWQKRLISSNIEYAMALFFLLFDALWQGIAVDAFSNWRGTFLLGMYRAFVFPMLLAGALVGLIPIDFDLQMETASFGWLIAVLWILVAGDPSAFIGHFLSRSAWFQEKIFKVGESRNSLLFQGMRGWSGILVLHVVILILYVADISSG